MKYLQDLDKTDVDDDDELCKMLQSLGFKHKPTTLKQQSSIDS